MTIREQVDLCNRIGFHASMAGLQMEAAVVDAAIGNYSVIEFTILKDGVVILQTTNAMLLDSLLREHANKYQDYNGRN